MEVESRLMEVDGVAECVVYGLSNAITGQSVHADVVSVSGIDARTLRQRIRKHCLSTMARYKVPSTINLVDKIAVNKRFKKMRPGE